MRKLMKNWIFTLILAVFLITFSVLMFIKGDEIMKYLIATALIVYVVLVLIDNVLHYRGRVLLAAVIEFAIILLLIFSLIFGFLDFLPVNSVGVVLGFIIWLRSVIEIYHGYVIKAGEESSKFTAKRLFAYILILSVGVFLMSSKSVTTTHLKYGSIVISIFCSVVLIFVTVKNRRVAQALNGARVSKKKSENNLETRKKSDGEKKNAETVTSNNLNGSNENNEEDIKENSDNTVSLEGKDK